MAKATTTYKCDYCSKTAKSLATITKHEQTCEFNTQLKDTYRAEIEHIRQTATSVPHLIQLLDTFWRSKGIVVTFTDYPNSWSDCVSNSHNAPNGYEQNWSSKADKPKGYPGWQGTWKGFVTTLPSYTGTSDLSFSHIIGNWSSGLFKIPFIKTGNGGGGGNTFQYSGMLFLYDFPLMHEQWKSTLGEYKQLGAEYDNTIESLRKEFITQQSQFVVTHKDHQKILSLSEDVSKLVLDVRDMQKHIRQHLESTFAQNNPIDLPKIPSAFIDNKAYQNTANLNLVSHTTNPNTESIFARAAELAEILTNYRTAHPEYFI